MNKDNKNTELDNTDKKLHISDVMFSSFYECCKCKLVSNEYKEHMIKNGMLDIVVKHINLFNGIT